MFPWENDARHPNKRRVRARGYNAAKAKNNYKKSGHPPWYGEYLKSQHWMNFKERWRKRNPSRRCCMICGEARYELHHITYERIGDERYEDVVPLCRGHHARAHKRERTGTPLQVAHLE